MPGNLIIYLASNCVGEPKGNLAIQAPAQIVFLQFTPFCSTYEQVTCQTIVKANISYLEDTVCCLCMAT